MGNAANEKAVETLRKVKFTNYTKAVIKYTIEDPDVKKYVAIKTADFKVYDYNDIKLSTTDLFKSPIKHFITD